MKSQNPESEIMRYAADAMDVLVLVANVACWGAIVVVWIAAAVREAGTRPATRVRGSTDIGMVVLAVVAVAAILLVGPSILAPFTVEAPWARLIGAGVLVGSTLFAIWARLALGRSWSVGPRAAADVGLRTDGPYAITRHPIYTGLLGMLLGSALLGGLGQWIVLVAAGLVVAELKIRSEERLLLETFPDAYAAYRERVPRLIPGWRWASARRRQPR
jgi:protein-S-isoprenylcysteine O-methyltransferase Ste14